jgi:NAD-specific glutamate dehydrogenase
VASAVERAVKWFLALPGTEEDVDEIVERFRTPAVDLIESWPASVEEPERSRAGGGGSELVAAGLPESASRRILALDLLPDALEVAFLAETTGVSAERLLPIYLQSSRVVDLDWVRGQLVAHSDSEDRWEQRAVEGLLEGLAQARRELVRQVLESGSSDADTASLLERFEAAHAAQIQALRSVIADLQAAPPAGLPGLLVVMRQLGRLLGR